MKGWRKPWALFGAAAVGVCLLALLATIVRERVEQSRKDEVNRQRVKIVATVQLEAQGWDHDAQGKCYVLRYSTRISANRPTDQCAVSQMYDQADIRSTTFERGECVLKFDDIPKFVVHRVHMNSEKAFIGASMSTTQRDIENLMGFILDLAWNAGIDAREGRAVQEKENLQDWTITLAK